MFETLKEISKNPGNTKYLAILYRWIKWNVWRRLSKKPKIIDFCSLKLSAYPDCPVSCLIRYTSNGLYDYDCMNFFIRFIEQKDVAVDVGAHIGAYTLLFANSAKRGRVIAIEPTPNTYLRLYANILLNRLGNYVYPINKAVGNEEGTVSLSIDRCNSMNHVKTKEEINQNFLLDVPCITLDSLVEDLFITRCDFLKIDVEGFEEKVILGGQEFLQKLNPKAILFEANGCSLNYDSDLSQAFKILKFFDFRIGYYNHDTNKICLIAGRPPVVSPVKNYFAFNTTFLEQVRDHCSIIS